MDRPQVLPFGVLRFKIIEMPQFAIHAGNNQGRVLYSRFMPICRQLFRICFVEFGFGNLFRDYCNIVVLRQKYMFALYGY